MPTMNADARLTTFSQVDSSTDVRAGLPEAPDVVRDPEDEILSDEDEYRVDQ